MRLIDYVIIDFVLGAEFIFDSNTELVDSILAPQSVGCPLQTLLSPDVPPQHTVHTRRAATSHLLPSGAATLAHHGRGQSEPLRSASTVHPPPQCNRTLDSLASSPPRRTEHVASQSPTCGLPSNMGPWVA